MRTSLAMLLACFWSAPLLAQCGFVAESVAATTWYRNEGWSPPGVTDGEAVGPISVRIDGRATLWPHGVTVSEIRHERSYRVTFPAAIFTEDGKRKGTARRTLGLHGLFRWEIDGKPYAYSYDLWPEGLLCTFSVDLVDDKGDGLFRVMATPGHIMQGKITSTGQHVAPQPPPLPEWARKPTS